MIQGTLLGGLSLHAGKVAVLPSFLLMSDVALGFERAQHGQHRGIGELVAQALLHVADHRGAIIPEHLHDIRFTVREGYFHYASLLKY